MMYLNNRLLLLRMLVFCCAGLFSIQISAQDNLLEEEEEPLPPPQGPNYYLQRYGSLGVPATLSGRDKVIIEGWVEDLDRGRIIKGVDQNGAIRYRLAKEFNIEANPNIGYRFHGNGYSGQANPAVTLNVGESYLFKVKGADRFPMLIHKPNPDFPYKFFPFEGFEVMANESIQDNLPVRITPRPDTPEEIHYASRDHFKLKGRILINKNSKPSTEGVIHKTVIVRRQIIKQYIALLAEGFIPAPISLGAETEEFYAQVKNGYLAGEQWYKSLANHAAPGHRLFYVRTDPKPLMNAANFTARFPPPEILEERPIFTLNALQQPQKGIRYLIKMRSSAQGDQFIKSLLEKEAKYEPEIRRRLNDPTSPTEMLRISSAQRLIEVNHKGSLNVFTRRHGGFEQELNRFRSLNITHAVDNDAMHLAKSLIFQGDYIRGLHQLRPIVYPLIKLAPIPKYFDRTRISTFQDDVEYLLGALLEGAQSDNVPENYQVNFMHEAFAIIYMLPLYELDNKEFIRKALTTVALLARTGNPKDSARANYLLNLIPFDKEDEESVAAFFKVAENFRSGGNFTKALEIYEQFFPLTESPFYREACLWSAFCRASSTPPQFGASQLSLDKFLDTYKAAGKTEPPRDTKYYSLWRLVEAILAYRDPLDKLDMALDRISEAVVYSRIGYEWVPEILALSAQCYAKKGLVDTAKNVYQELKVFYPKHPKTRQFEIDFPDIVGN